jgi:hypothetical protein
MDPRIPIPRGWNRRAKSAIIHILALSHYTFTVLVARAANDRNRRTRIRAEIDRLEHEIALLQEEFANQGRPNGPRSAPPPASLCTP